MPDIPGKYGLLFSCMADAIDRYVSRLIPYATPPAESTHSQFGLDILGSTRNITGDRLYTSIETAEQLFLHNVTSVGT